jgi:hypothetical protein
VKLAAPRKTPRSRPWGDVSILTTAYTRAGFNTTLTPPGPGGIYYPSVAVYNALTQLFVVQNGVAQNTLAIQQAQLFSVPTAGGTMLAQPLPRFYPYGSYLGPLQAVWYEPTDQPGSYPVSLGALTGLIQWTPVVDLSSSSPIYLVPGTSITAVVVENATDTTETITVTGYQSSTVLGTATLAGNNNVQINLEGGTDDTIFEVTSSGPISATLSIIVGIPPGVNTAGGGGGGVTFYASLLGPGQFASPGDLTQTGGFSVLDAAGDGINLTTTGLINLDAQGSAGVISLTSAAGGISAVSPGGVIALGSATTAQVYQQGLLVGLYSPPGGGGVVIQAQASTGEVLMYGGGGVHGNQVILAEDLVTLTVGSLPTRVVLDGTTESMRLDATSMGFFNAAPVVQQVSGGSTAGVIAGLVNLGLFSS